jgi:predicted RNA-binding protein with PUA-like domain
MNYWLVKSEPDVYSWDKFVAMDRDMWEGVRNYQARNNLKAMRENDIVLFYHSNEQKAVVGIAKVVRESYPDPTAIGEKGDWVVVDLSPVESLKNPVTLAAIKAEPRLQSIALIRQSRLSVMPISPEEFGIIMEMSGV